MLFAFEVFHFYMMFAFSEMSVMSDVRGGQGSFITYILATRLMHTHETNIFTICHIHARIMLYAYA